MQFKAPLLIGLAWAVMLLLTALYLPSEGSWTIDDSVKYISARTGTGVWAEVVPDGPLRRQLSDPAAYPPIHPPFAQRTNDGFAFGFSPWTRGLFKLIARGGWLLWRLAPAIIAVAFWVLLMRAGLTWSFLLLPLTFYGLVPWEHVLSWLLAWPALREVVKGAGWQQPTIPLVGGQQTPIPLVGSQQTSIPRPFPHEMGKGEKRRRDLVRGLLLSLAMLLRPEMAILAAVLVGFLLFRKSFRSAFALAAGAAVGLGAMIVWHAATSSQTALAQIHLNPIGPGEGESMGGWLAGRLTSAYQFLFSMDRTDDLSLILLVGFATGVVLLMLAQRKKSKTMLGLALGVLALWAGFYQYRLWSAPLPPLALIFANSLYACLPWVALLVVPPYRKRPALLLAGIVIALVVLTAPLWDGVHWGPRILLFAVPLLLLDLYQSGRARGWAFHALLVLTAVQTLSSAALVYARATETADRIRLGAAHLGTPLICPTMSQCADLAPLWPDHEFFTAANPSELRQLLIELRDAKVDTVWLHVDAFDSLYIQTFPNAKPVRPYHMTVLRAGTLYKTTWRIYELVMNREDSLWAGILEREAGRFVIERRLDRALHFQREAVAVAPGSAQVHNNLALILAAVGDTTGAREEAGTAVKLNPDLREPRRLLDMLQSPTSSAP